MVSTWTLLFKSPQNVNVSYTRKGRMIIEIIFTENMYYKQLSEPAHYTSLSISVSKISVSKILSTFHSPRLSCILNPL